MGARIDWARWFATTLAVGLAGLTIMLVGRPVQGQSDGAFPIYVDGLAPGWQDWSWARHELVSRELPFQGRAAIKMIPAGWAGVYLHHDVFGASGYSVLSLWVNGGSSGGQKVSVCAVLPDGKFGPRVDLAAGVGGRIVPRGRWAVCIITLRQLGVAGGRLVGVSFQDATGGAQAPMYLADVRLAGRATTAAAKPYVVTVDTARDAHPISPLIYGMANASPEFLRDLRLGANRWGGNPNTRYNWERGNCWNAARDWEFRNGNYGSTSAGDRAPSGVADRFVANSRAARAAVVLTIPTIGFVARDDDNASCSVGVPASGGPPVSLGSQAIAGYDPAENRKRTSIASYARKRAPFRFPPDLTDAAVYQDEWVDHLVRKFGKAAEGGVRFYAMDNEPDLWAGTHTDIHPVNPDYDELLSRFLEYGTAVKDVDPTARVTGPVSWGWTGYFHSPRDQGKWTERPDRKAHGDLPFIPWFLQQARAHDRRTGKRLLDVLDVHYYPQGAGVYKGATDPGANALRLRSTRALWDPSYADESWIGEPVMLIPRMKAWIARYYPGTALGITEWNWGADSTVNGGLAAAECLGVFGREGVDLANYWTTPPPLSPGYLAFKMYRNADGKGLCFGDRSVYARSTVPDDVSCFGSVDTATGRPVLLLLNKRAEGAATVTVNVRHSKPVTRAALWRYGPDAPTEIRPLAGVAVGGGQMKLSLPASSMTLVVLQ